VGEIELARNLLPRLYVTPYISHLYSNRRHNYYYPANGLTGVVNGLADGGCVADLTRDELQRLARLGAKSRLDELRREEAAIRRAFPDLFGGRGGQVARTGRRRRSNMSAAARKAVSERMKKYWADRRKKKAGAK
jgi:hypothetical protein